MAGNAAFRYTPPGGSLITVPLNIPLTQVAPAGVRRTWSRESLDMSVRETWTVGSSAHEITARIEGARNPQPLVDMLSAARDGAVLTYYPDLSGPGLECILIHDGPVMLLPDSLGRWGEYEVVIRLRRTNGETWEGLLT